jgi:hypothetical protein
MIVKKMGVNYILAVKFTLVIITNAPFSLKHQFSPTIVDQ